MIFRTEILNISTDAEVFRASCPADNAQIRARYDLPRLECSEPVRGEKY